MEDRSSLEQEIQGGRENFKFPNFVKFAELTKQLSESSSPLKRDLISKKLKKLRKKVFAEVAVSELIRQSSQKRGD